jgi:hypothetical protein
VHLFEAVVLVAALKTTVADSIEGMFESKKEGMVVTLAPLTASAASTVTYTTTSALPLPMAAAAVELAFKFESKEL